MAENSRSFGLDISAVTCYASHSMKVLVCGGRKPLPNDYALILSELAKLDLTSEDTVIQGGARGVDTLARAAALRIGCQVATYPAEWDVYGRAAGTIRNQKMLDSSEPDLVLAFPSHGSVGTYDMMRRAKKAGVKTWVYHPNDGDGRCPRSEF